MESQLGKDAAAGALMSAYEIARAARIRENQQFMEQLGLSNAKKHLAQAAGVTKTKASASSSSSSSSTNTKPRKRKANRPPPGPSRRSSRLKGDATQLVALTGSETFEEVEYDSDDNVIVSETSRTAEEMKVLEALRKENRAQLYKELLGRHNENGLKLPPTATYEHTVMRVETMSEKRLHTRVKVIERAAGQYAVLKMRMFAEVLVLEGMEDIAKEAEEALARLLQLPKFLAAARDLRRLYIKLKQKRSSTKQEQKKQVEAREGSSGKRDCGGGDSPW